MSSISKGPKWHYYGVAVLGIHILGFAMLLMNLKQYPQLFGFAFVAYTLGLRHAFERTDHRQQQLLPWDQWQNIPD